MDNELKEKGFDAWLQETDERGRRNLDWLNTSKLTVCEIAFSAGVDWAISQGLLNEKRPPRHYTLPASALTVAQWVDLARNASANIARVKDQRTRDFWRAVRCNAMRQARKLKARLLRSAFDRAWL